MILHVVIDDKFIDMAYNIFEKVSPGNNEFMIVTKQQEFKYVKTTPITKIRLLTFLSKKFARSLINYEFVVLHWLDDFKKQLVLNAPKEVRFVWIGWGGDYYIYVNKKLYLSLTYSLKNNILIAASHIGFVSRIKNILIQKFFLNNVDKIDKVLNRIDYFAPVLEEDYKLLAASFEDFNPKYVDWNYGTLEDDLIRDSEIEFLGKNILVGNSATAENNHLEAFELLQNLDLGERKIICPLSYGDFEYGKVVENRAKELFGNRIKTLTTFMPLKEYNKIISSCSIVIMNHLRQQALGNIVIMMYFGAKVFVNKENPIYIFFKQNGAVIFSTDELNYNNIETVLSSDEIKHNREVLRKYWSREVALSKTKNLIKRLQRM